MTEFTKGYLIGFLVGVVCMIICATIHDCLENAEKKMYEAGQHDVANDIASCFGIATGTLEEDRFLKRLAKAVDYES